VHLGDLSPDYDSTVSQYLQAVFQGAEKTMGHLEGDEGPLLVLEFGQQTSSLATSSWKETKEDELVGGKA
jgi:hypothetical protein